jgi:hypothetical protein
VCCLNYAIFNTVFCIQYSIVSTLHCQAYFTFNNYIFLLVTEGNPTAGQSVDDTGILSCVQTFGYMLLFAAIGVVILTFTTILLCICVPNDASSLVGK